MRQGHVSQLNLCLTIIEYINKTKKFAIIQTRKESGDLISSDLNKMGKYVDVIMNNLSEG
jgi:hypothetical protein